MEAALAGLAPVIGKAPDFVHLGLGHPDMLNGAGPEPILRGMEAVVQTLLLKTRARITVANLCEAFLPEEIRGTAREYNAGFAAFKWDSRVRVVDLSAPVNAFLEKHRRSGGEKRSLHEKALRPTSMGRIFLAHTAYDLLLLEDFLRE